MSLVQRYDHDTLETSMTNISSSAIDSQQKLFQNFSSLISLSREQESVIGSLKEELAEQKSLLASANGGA